VNFPEELPEKLRQLGLRLLDQHAARTLVPALGEASGYWFGGGNFVQEPSGDLLLCGRYRNPGDARKGTDAGERGLEFSIFRATNPEGPFEKIHSFSKADLSTEGASVVSIEGGSLLPSVDGDSWELFVSTEKQIPYPKNLIHFQKPGTGVWSIDCLSGDSSEPTSISTENSATLLSTSEGGFLHMKDPVAFRTSDGFTQLVFCSHPFSWSSSNTGLATREASGGSFHLVSKSLLDRGPSWDVACVRVTERLPLPQVGILESLPPLSLYFYDGAECLRSLDQNPKAARRPRGYSCEELGGLAWGFDDEFPKLRRISQDFPLFVSPHATGCSRYASASFLADGTLAAAWQQVAADGSQPLVGHSLNAEEVARILRV
jgi:hypothetical protein